MGGYIAQRNFRGYARTTLRFLKHLLRRRIPRDGEAVPLFDERIGSFLSDNNRGRRVQICLGERRFTTKRSGTNGHFKGVVRMSAAEMDELVEGQTSGGRSCSFSTHAGDGDPRIFAGRIHLLPSTGLSVISDIDDTIKITEVLSKRTMLRNTFLRQFAGVPEMAALYRRWRDQRGATFHYVSASPWQLYSYLADFLKSQDFPDGTFHLRDFRIMPGDIHRTLRPSRRIKLAHARGILRQFPRRTFILIGDSGESDIRIYAKLLKQFPRQIEKILIRNVTPGKPLAPRQIKAMTHVPAGKMQLFTDPSEIV